MSDLHLEFDSNTEFFRKNSFQVEGDILILAGDICNLKHRQVADIIPFRSYKRVFWVYGNHEYYGSDLTDHHANSVTFMDDICVIQTTLWSYIPDQVSSFCEHSLNDFRRIRRRNELLRASTYNALHRSSMDFLENALNSYSFMKTVVITHHAPTFENYPEQYKGSMISCCFATDLNNLILKYQPNYWVYGHTHGNTPDFKIGETQMLTNQVGYVRNNEHLGFNMKAAFEL